MADRAGGRKAPRGGPGFQEVQTAARRQRVSPAAKRLLGEAEALRRAAGGAGVAALDARSRGRGGGGRRRQRHVSRGRRLVWCGHGVGEVQDGQLAVPPPGRVVVGAGGLPVGVEQAQGDRPAAGPDGGGPPAGGGGGGGPPAPGAGGPGGGGGGGGARRPRGAPRGGAGGG